MSGSHSQDTAGGGNYVEKINFRRETDGEVRREGWSSLNLDGNAVDVIDSENAPIRLLTQFESGGKRILIGSAGDKIYKLDESNSEWVKIAEGLVNIDRHNHDQIMNDVIDIYGKKPIKPEVVVIDGYCIINNGVDLPLMYRDGWPCAFPLFSLRERGIIRVGTISEFDGRLFIADVEYFDETVDYNFSYFMSSASFPYYLPEAFDEFDEYTTTYVVPHIIEFSSWRLADDQREARAAPNLFGQNYEANIYAMSNGSIITITLDYPLGGTRETGSQGLESFTHNPYYYMLPDELASMDYSHSTFIAGDSIRMSVTDSLGVTKVYDADIVSINSNWLSSKTFIVLQGAYNNTSTGVLTYQGNEQSTASTQNVVVGDDVNFILLKEPDIFSPNPKLSREASDSFAFPEDGSRILKMAKLGDKLIVHRQTGYLAISRGDNYTPFYYEERYKGERVADFRNTVINVDEQRQIFVGFNGVFAITPATVEPVPFTPLMTGPEFWRLITNQQIEYVYSSENPLTQEVFIVAPIGSKTVGTSKQLDWGIVAYDMLQGSISLMDYAFSAMTAVFPTDVIEARMFVMASHLLSESYSNNAYNYAPFAKAVDSEVVPSSEASISKLGARVVRYGYGSSAENLGPYREFARNGRDYPCTLKFGKNDFGDRFSEKKLRSYALHMSDTFDYTTYTTKDYVEDSFTDTAVIANVKLASFSTSQDSETEEVTEELEDLNSEVMIPTYAQGNYFQDTIILTGVDQPFKIIGRTFEASGVRTKLIGEVVTDAS